MPRQHSSVFQLFFVFAALLGLLALTVEAARHDLGRWNFAVAVLIAAIKALLIALFFMHVRHSTSLTKLVVAAGIVWLAIMFTLSLADYWTRDWHGTPVAGVVKRSFSWTR
jgi:cytochrome c oxidase subunit 4